MVNCMQIEIEKYKQKSLLYVQRLGDLRFTGQLVFAVIVLLITWSGIKSIQTNYSLQKQISGLRQQVDLQQLRNNNLALQNEYLSSNQYLDVAARQNFGLAAPGEKELIVPESVAMAYTVNLPTVIDQNATATQQPGYQQNFQSWVNFFLHRQGN
jgi:cell division protein FtsB